MILLAGTVLGAGENEKNELVFKERERKHMLDCITHYYTQKKKKKKRNGSKDLKEI